jgi:hypothetical protein
MILHACDTLPNCFANYQTPTFVLMIFCSVVIVLRGDRQIMSSIKCP